jgi:hypothetical protein
MTLPRYWIGLGILLISLVSAWTTIAGETCYCRTSTGKHVEVGKVACLKTNHGMEEARCGFVLNNTAWKFTGNPCPVAEQGGEQDKKIVFATVLPR